MIPAFDHNLVLPPHLGSPTEFSQLSPYGADMLEFCQHFGTSPERIEILEQFLRFRETLRDFGLLNGYQWLDGSFVENIEQQEMRPPRDLDVVTIYWGYDTAFQQDLLGNFPEFADPVMAKQNYKVDHYPFDAGIEPTATVELSRYWTQLFSHNRNGVWKGMVAVGLDTVKDDSAALAYLQTLKL